MPEAASRQAKNKLSATSRESDAARPRRRGDRMRRDWSAQALTFLGSAASPQRPRAYAPESRTRWFSDRATSPAALTTGSRSRTRQRPRSSARPRRTGGDADRLPALIHMNMLNPHELRAAAP